MSSPGRSLTRRTFLATGAAGLGAAPALKALGQAAPPEAKPAPAPILERPLGRTGLKVPVVSMGVMNASLPDLVKRSFELGVRHFDTAAYYQRGRNEEMVGQALKELKARPQAIIATKAFLPPPRRSEPAAQVKAFYLKSAEESLRRLQTDYVDVFYLHNAMSLEDLRHDGVREAMEQLKRQGKVRHVGFSTHMNMAGLLEEAVRDPYWEVILTTFNFALHDDARLQAALRAAAAKGIGLVAMKTQASQDWYRENLPEAIQRMYKGALVHTAVLKWVLQHPFIATAVPGYTNFEQMEEDFSVARGLALTPQERAFLASREVKLALGYCRQCTQCLGTCPSGVDIPGLMRVHLYTACYRNFHHARQTYDEIPAGRRIEACADCGACRARCVHGVDVPGRLQDLTALYG